MTESILLNDEKRNDLETLLKSKNLGSKKWRLLYRGSRDGFRATDFHAKCDGKANTLTVVKDTKKNIFGGFTCAQWDQSSRFKVDTNAFIFSLVNSLQRPLVFDHVTNGNYSKHSIDCYSTHGPAFGGGHDLHISDNSNSNTNSYTELGFSYVNPAFESDINPWKLHTFFTGSRNFQVADFEVFQKE